MAKISWLHIHTELLDGDTSRLVSGLRENSLDDHERNKLADMIEAESGLRFELKQAKPGKPAGAIPQSFDIYREVRSLIDGRDGITKTAAFAVVADRRGTSKENVRKVYSKEDQLATEFRHRHEGGLNEEP